MPCWDTQVPQTTGQVAAEYFDLRRLPDLHHLLTSRTPFSNPLFFRSAHHNLTTTPSCPRCLEAVPPSTSRASATALAPAISPTNSNGNSDPSIPQPTPCPSSSNQNKPPTVLLAPRPRPSPSNHPREEEEKPLRYVLKSSSSSCRITSVVSCLPPYPPRPPSIERSAMFLQTSAKKRRDVSLLKKRLRLWPCIGQVACQRYPLNNQKRETEREELGSSRQRRDATSR